MAAKTWTSTTGGDWSNPALWSPSGVPQPADDAILIGPTGTSFQRVNGPGTSASLTLLGTTLLSGNFSAGMVSVGNAGTPGALTLTTGASLTTGSTTLLYGPLTVSGTGAKLTVSGTLTLGGGRTNYNYGGNVLTLNTGGVVRTGNLVLAPISGSGSGTDGITIDAASALEVGSAGGAALGKLTVDAGQVVSGAGSISASNGIANAGTIIAQGGTLVLSGGVTGAGQMQIGAGATLALNSVSTGSVSFTGAGGTLSFSEIYGYDPVTFAPVYTPAALGSISGFVPGDTLFTNYTIASATYQAGSNGIGTLRLSNGATSFGSLTLVGDYSGYSFLVTPASGYGSNITVARASGGGGTPSPGTSNPDSYAWLGPASGNWGDAANWKDTTTGASPAAVAPGRKNLVTLTGPAGTSYQVISGPGNSASLTLLGNTSLSGAFDTGALMVGSGSTPGALNLTAGTALAAATATLVYGPVTVGGTGSRLTVTGTLSLGGTRTDYAYADNTLTVSGGGSVIAGGLVLGAVSGSGSDIISVDGTSTLEVGSAGGTALGKLTIDAGQVVAGAGTITAQGGIANAGTVLAQGGTLVLSGSVTGPGQLQVGAGATLWLGGRSTEAISFVGGGGTLATSESVASSGTTLAYTPNAQGVVSGFVPGNTLYTTATLDSVAYRANGGSIGTLRLDNGATSHGSLTLVGDYTGYVFLVTPASTSGTNITLARAGGGGGTPSPGTANPDVYAWLGTVGGTWGDAANWTDTTTGARPAAIAPGSNNLVTITGPAGTSYQLVNGPGNSASLTVLGNTSLSGAFNTGALSVGSAAAEGALSLAPGTTLAANSAALLGGPLVVSGTGTRLSVSGSMTLGGTRTSSGTVDEALTIAGGAAVQVGRLMLAPMGGAGSGTDSVGVDATSTLEVGTGGSVAAGKLTIDAGQMVVGLGTITASNGIANAGTILAQGGTLSLNAGVDGTGQMQIGPAATLSLAGLSTGPVAFTGAGGTLSFRESYGYDPVTLAATYTPTAQGSISGFAPGDTLYTNATIGRVVYQAAGTGAGTLKLSSGTTSYGSLTLLGDFSSYTFQVTPSGSAGSNIVLAPVPAAADPLFDGAYYLARNPDVAAAGIDPYQHYLASGYREGRDPSALFSTSYYLSHNPDVAAAGLNPLLHFEASGYAEGRDPSAGFSLSDYRAANPDVKAAGIDPLLHYVTSGRAEGRAAFAVNPNPDPLVDAAYYYAHNPDVARAGIDASAHYLATGYKELRNPDAFFDTSYYLAQNPDVKAAGINPLLHFEQSGWREGRQPSLVFDDAKYLAAYPDVKAAGLDPLLHYVLAGRAEGRMSFLTGGSAAADPLIQARYYDPQLGATLIPSGAAAEQQAAFSYDSAGWQKGLNPDAYFDTTYYLSHNPDVAAARIDPLKHYEVNGWREGRDPSAAFSTSKYLAAYSDVKAAGLDPLLHYVVNGQAEGRTAFHV